MSSSSRSLIALEVQAVDILHIKSMSKTRDNPKALVRLLIAFRNFLQTERDLPIDPNLSNKKKKIIVARQHEIVELINLEIDRLCFTFDDARRYIFNYHKSRYGIHQQFLLYMQPIEEGLTTQKNKLLLRMEGFTKQIIDNIFDDSKPNDVHHNSTYVELNKANNAINNTIIYKLQYAAKELVSRNYLPDVTYFKELFQWHSNDDTIAKSIKDSGSKLMNNYNPLKVPIVLLNALQYLDILSSHNLTLFKQHHGTFILFKNLIHTFISIIPEAFLIIKQWRHAAHLDLIGIFLFQTVQTLRSVLDMMLLLHLDMVTPPPDSVSSNNANNSKKSEKRSDTESRMRNQSYDSMEEKPENESLPGSLHMEDLDDPETDQTEFWDNCFTSPLERKAKKAANEHTLLNEHRYSMHHLATDLVLMLKVVKQSRVHNGRNGNSRLIFTSHGSLSNYGVSDASELHGYTSSNKNDTAAVSERDTLIVNKYDETEEIDDHINNSFNQFLGLVASYTSLGSSLITNLLHCADMVMTIKAAMPGQSTAAQQHIPVIMNTLPHEMLRAALEVGQLCLAQYTVRVEGFNSLNSYSINDTAYVMACDNEAIAITTIATQSFSNCIPDALALDILKMAHELCIARCSCFLLVSAFFKCDLAACLWVINSSALAEVSEREIKHLMETQYQARVAALLEEASVRTKGKKPYAAVSRGNTLKAGSPVLIAAPIATATSGGAGYGLGVKRPSQLTTPTSMAAAGKKASFSAPPIESPTAVSKTGSASVKVPPRVDMKFALARRVDVIGAVGESLLRIMGLMYQYRTTLSISHCGMMLVRLITRDLFIKKNKVDEYLTVMLSKQLLPLQEYLVLKKDTDDDEMPGTGNTAASSNNQLLNNEFDSEQNSRATTPAETPVNPNNPDNVGTLDLTDLSSVSRASTPQDTDRRSVNSAGGAMSSRSNNSRSGNAVPTTDYVRTWKMNNMLNIVLNSGVPIIANPRSSGGSRGGGSGAGGPVVQHTAECSFVDLLHYIGENHLQSGEVMEQLLLLVEHLAAKSQLNKYLLIESGLLPVVMRIKDTTRWDNNYILALSEICIELIDI